MNIQELIRRFREIHAKTTPGPWVETYGAQRDPVCAFPIVGATGNEPKAFFIHGANGKNGTTDQVIDAAFIIAVHTRLPEILDVLERVIAERDAALALLRECGAAGIGHTEHCSRLDVLDVHRCRCGTAALIARIDEVLKKADAERAIDVRLATPAPPSCPESPANGPAGQA